MSRRIVGWVFALLACPFVFAAAPTAEAPLPQDWAYAPAMRAVAAKGAGRPGVVLHVGDSITYASPYAAWARAGDGRTDDDLAALRWMHAGAKDDTDGWHLATFDHPAGGRSYTACSGIRADEMLAGGKRDMPKLAALLDQYKPQAVVLMLGTNDASAERPVEAFIRNVDSMLDEMLTRGIVPIVSTIPPHVHRTALAASYNEALRNSAKRRALPLIDFEREILARRPKDWDGTLLTRGDVHPTAAGGGGKGGATAASAPTPENLRNCGYLLRGWLSVKKIGEVKRDVFDVKAALAPQPDRSGPPDVPRERLRLPAAPPLPKATGPVVRVTTVDELIKAVESARPGDTIALADGHYALDRCLDIRADGVTLRGESGQRGRVILDGAANRYGELVGIGACAGVTVADLTLCNARTNAVKLDSDRGATRFTLRNCVLHNVWQRGVKGVAVRPADRDRVRPTDCRVEYCLFHNDRPKRFDDDPDDTAANFGGNYVAGIDAMDARRWTISDNAFVGIHGRTREARAAVFLWQGAEECVVERNVIVDCDAGICLGNAARPTAGRPEHCRGCVVRNNFVTRCPEQGIAAVRTRDCRIVHNTVFEPASRFGRLIRVLGGGDDGNAGLVVANNLLGDRPVLVEGTGRADLRGNCQRDLAALCPGAAAGDLHLKPGIVLGETCEPVDAVSEDIDRQRRPPKPTAGADEPSPQ